MMRHATFRQLQVFEAIARLGSFSRAAEELFLTQPTVSMQMKKLADTVGMPLTEQIGKRIHLTDAGRELAVSAREILQTLDRFDMSVSEMQGLKKGKLRLAVVTTAKYFIPRLLGDFLTVYPGVEVSLKVTNRERVLARAADNIDDLYILSEPLGDLNLAVKPFMKNPMVVLAPPDHPLAKAKNIPMKRLAEEPFLIREFGSGTRLATEQMFARHNLKMRIRMELGSNEAIKQAVLGGLGVSVLSHHTLAGDHPSFEPVILDVAGFPIMRNWHVAYPQGKQLSVIARKFLEYIFAAVQDYQSNKTNVLSNAGLRRNKPLRAVLP